MNNWKPIAIIVLVGVFFGVAHIISGEPWSNGKFAQAAISGIIIGWVYYRYGLLSAILVHWATNYFIYAHILFVSDLNQLSIQNAVSNSMISTLEVILIVTGLISIAIILLNYLNEKNQKKLSV